MNKNELLIAMTGYDLIITFENQEHTKEALRDYLKNLEYACNLPMRYIRGEKGVRMIRRCMNDYSYYIEDIVIDVSKVQVMYSEGE